MHGIDIFNFELIEYKICLVLNRKKIKKRYRLVKINLAIT